MSESRQEQHPLLCDESEEDYYSPRYQRRFRPMVFRSRVGNNIKGAAAIIKRWPDHWYSTVIYWWLGIGMIAITTLVIYNGVIAFALIPSQQITVPRYPTVSKAMTTDQSSSLPVVSMHVFINSINDIDVTKYLPYIEIISNKYFDYKYHLIFVVNDTNDDRALSAEENNEIALNSLLDKSRIHENINGVIIEHVNLSKYMNNSPLRKHWKSLPLQYIEFLVRAISIWDKGGIAFNPVILTPYSPNAIYMEKLRGILVEYKKKINKQNVNNVTTFEMKKNRKGIEKPAKKMNNIRDIIDALEHNDIDTYNQHSLTEAEDNEIPTLALVERSTENLSNGNEIKEKTLHKADLQLNAMPTEPIAFDSKDMLMMTTYEHNATVVNNNSKLPFSNNETATINLLPLFLKFLFTNKVTGNVPKIENNEEPTKVTLTRKRKSVIAKESYKINNNLMSATNNNDIIKNETAKYRPMIISTNKSGKDIKKTNTMDELKYYDGQLIIDLKGNILATKTPCHAFIGTVFNNVIHHSQNESVTDFIITELSLFCKGLLSTCRGIDVLLL